MNCSFERITITTACLALLCLTAGSVHAQEETPMQHEQQTQTDADAAMQAPPVIPDPGAEYAPETRIFQGIPGIERASNGRLWATWYGGGPGEGPHNYVMLSTSGDDGETWSDLTLVIDPPGRVRAFDPALWVDPLGRMWLFWAQAVQLWDGRAGVWAIVTENPGDESPEWSEPRRLADGIMMNKPLALSNGDWLLPAAIWQRASNAGEDGTGVAEQPSGSNVIASTDQGQTWDFRGSVDIPERSCDEHMLVERADGTLWMLVRTTYGIGEAFSDDGGRTWTEGRQSWIPHISSARFFIRKLASGNLILVKHSPRDGRTRSHLTAYLSEDDGRTWQGGLLLDERKGVSYPDGTQAEDGTIYVIYDYLRYGDKQILMAKVTEEDILAGEAVSDAASFRVLVNEATGEPQAREVKLAENADAAALLTEPGADVKPGAGQSLATLEVGAKLFTDRDYVVEDLPSALAGARFVRGSIGSISATVESDGVVWVLTPTAERNDDTLELALYREGFERARVPEFVLFGGISANAVTVFQKRCSAGERLEFGKWGVLAAPAG
ncbi:MAG: sialidase family protein [Armatimonadota bacterium]